MQIQSSAFSQSRKIVPAPRLPGSKELVLPEEPTPRLERPVLVVPGGNSRPWGLPAVLHYLCHGGENTYGGSIRSDKLQDFAETHSQHGGNVFALEYTRHLGGVEENSHELTAVIEAILKNTGATEIDVVAECKGALETRFHLQENGDGIRNLVQLVPPNRGMNVAGDLASMVAEVSVALDLGLKKIGYFEVSPDTLDTFRDMRTDLGLGWNPTLQRMNQPEGLAKEKKALHSNTILMGTHNRTLGIPTRHLSGDGMVTPWSAHQEGARHFGFTGSRSDHGRLSTHPQALEKMREALLNDGRTVADNHFLSDFQSPANMGASLALQAASLAGKGVALHSAFTGQALGPLGLGFVAATGLNAGRDLLHYTLDAKSSPSGLKRGLQAAASVGSLAGVAAALTGHPVASAALLGASQLVGVLAG